MTMQVLTGKITDMQLPKKLSLAIGNFDGIHLGHQAVLHKTVQKSWGLASAVLTFSPHPRQVMTPNKAVKYICTKEQKIELLRKLNIDYLLIADFDAALFQLSAHDFISTILLKQLQCQSLTAGVNFKFGKDRLGDDKFLHNSAAQHSFIYDAVETIEKKPYKVSSTIIRSLLKRGMIRQVNNLLGRIYTISGKVLPGKKLARQVGFKTANLILSTDLALPLYGVYYVQVHVDSSRSRKIEAVANIGLRPTVCDDIKPLLEVHLLDFTDDIYEQYINVEFICFIRPERKFAGIAALRAQIQKDIQDARINFISS